MVKSISLVVLVGFLLVIGYTLSHGVSEEQQQKLEMIQQLKDSFQEIEDSILSSIFDLASHGKGQEEDEQDSIVEMTDDNSGRDQILPQQITRCIAPVSATVYTQTEAPTSTRLAQNTRISLSVRRENGNGSSFFKVANQNQWIRGADLKPCPSTGTPSTGTPVTMPTNIKFVASPNKSSRQGQRIQFIILHNTQGSLTSTLSWFQQTRSQVSAHYVVGREGELIQMVSDTDNAWHAGDSTVNRQSIGIEIVSGYSGVNGMTSVQEQAVIRLVKGLMRKYSVSVGNVRPHRSVVATACPGSIWSTDAIFNSWKSRNL